MPWAKPTSVCSSTTVNAAALVPGFMSIKVYDEFLEKSVKAAHDRPVGDPFTDVEQGPLVDKLQFDKVMGYIQDGKNAGANVAAGGGRMFDKGISLSPQFLPMLKKMPRSGRRKSSDPSWELPSSVMKMRLSAGPMTLALVSLLVFSAMTSTPSTGWPRECVPALFG